MSDNRMLLITHPHNGHTPNDTCIGCVRAEALEDAAMDLRHLAISDVPAFLEREAERHRDEARRAPMHLGSEEE